jgi:aerobic carbon-monoxide dehydrogenase medium subunit
MIPGAFSYHRPRTINEAVTLLAQYGDGARILAGGQSLIPMMKLRLATPEHLVDLAAVPDLDGVARDGNRLVIGAMTTQSELIEMPEVLLTVPLLREAALVIADPQVRYVGTLGGNVANGDPGNDMPAVMMGLDARYRLTAGTGSRTVAARDFYKGVYATALAPGEMLTAIEIPVPPKGHGYAYEKLKRKVGDYATAAAAVVLTLDADKVTTCAITLSNLADRPLIAEKAAAAIVGSHLDKPAIEAAMAAARAIMAPAEDTRGSVEYRTSVGGVMVERALKRAYARAREQQR